MDENKKAYEQAPPPMMDRQGNPANAYSQPTPEPAPQNAQTGGPIPSQGGPYQQGPHGYTDGMTPRGAYYHTEVRYESKGDGKAWASMILGIFSLLCCCCVPCISVIFSILGLIFGILSLKDEPTGRGLAIAGIVCSAVSMFMVAVSMIVIFANSLNGNFRYDIEAFPQFRGFDRFF